MKRNITIWGSSTNNVFIYCYICKKKVSWLKANEIEKGLYKAICYDCNRKLRIKGGK